VAIPKFAQALVFKVLVEARDAFVAAHPGHVKVDEDGIE
jgi:hypothetical protein